MNVFSCTGNLGRDAEVRYTQSGTAICSFSIPVKSGFGEHEKTTWVRCNLWGKRAESGLVKYLVKGQMIAVHGELSLNEYTDKEGNARSSIELNVSDLTLCGRAGGGSQGGGAGGGAPYQGGAQNSQPQKSKDPFADSPDFKDVPVDDDIPF